MKKLQVIAVGMAFVLAVILTLHAQTAISVKPVFIHAPVQTAWSDDLETMIQAVEQTTPVAANSRPMIGTFWSVQNPTWPPLPGNTIGVPVWPLDDNTFILADADFDYTALDAKPLRGGMRMMAMDGPPGLDDGGDGGTNTYYGSPAPLADYGTNLWIAQVSVSSGSLVGIITNSQADILYEIQSTTNLAQPGVWSSEGFVYGSELTNWTAMAVVQGNRPNLFLRIRSWADSNNSGIPDWWWLTYFGQTTNVNASASAAGDGYSNLQKFQMGLNPTNYYNPNALTGFFGAVVGTNAFIYWNSTSNAVNYAIQRGILNTNTGIYSYTQFLASSNATWFEDVGAITNANAQNDTYSLEAVYPGGSLSGTNTWHVWWYASYSSYGPPYGPPLPGNVYAYADVTGTNILLSWTPAGSPATNYIILHGVSTNYSYIYQQVAQVSTNTLSTEIFGVLTNLNDWSDGYAVEAVYPGGALSYAASSYVGSPVSATVNVGSNTNTNAPANFYGFTDSTGTNIFLTWNAVAGATNYIVYGASYDYGVGVNVHTIFAKVGVPTNSFTVRGAIDGSGNNLYEFYNVVAVYTNSSLSQSATWYPGNGAPAPAILSAYLDSTGTNVLLSWTAATGATPTGYLIQKSDYYGESWSYYQIGDVSSSTTSFEDIDGVDSGYDGIGSIEYQVQATYPNGGLSPAVTATIATTPPAPSNLSAVVDSTGTNVSLAWSPAMGGVTGYTILRGTYNSTNGSYNYSQIGTVGAGTTTFQDTGAISSNNGYNNIYEVEADYAGGSVSSPDSSSVYQPSPPPTYNLNVTAQMVRNQTGHWQLMFSSIPTNVQAIAFYWYSCDYFYGFGPSPDGAPLTTENDIPVGSITNGIYVLPDFLMTNWFPSDWIGKIAMVQPIGTNGEYGKLCQAGFQPDDSPCFVDGRQHLKQNLLFELRAATISQRNSPLSENDIWWNPFFINVNIPADTNYVESSIFHWSEQFNAYGSYYNDYIKMDDVWPITANYELHGNLYDTNSVTSFVWQPNLGDLYAGPNLSFQGTLATIPAPAVLGVGDPYWTLQAVTTYVGSPGTGLTLVYNSSITDLAAYTNSGSLFLQSGAHNLFGLSFTNAMVNEGGVDYSHYPYQTYPPISLSPGGSIALSNADAFFNPNVFFSQTADPSLQITNYYFAPVNTPGTALAQFSTPYQPYPLPALTGFASTNQTPIIITSVGTPTVIGGWAKEKILNGSSTKFGYLGQYFVTNAYVVNTNGTLTTNTTGIVSPYGDFFPTQVGQVALVTMPDIDTSQQGTGVVDVISLNVDANHDGTMNFKYYSPDFVSSSKPFRFWVNDVSDSGDFGGDGIPGQGALGDGVLQTQVQDTSVPYLSFQSVWQINGRRDLVNYFPVCLNIGSLFQSNALSAGISATDTNYQFILSQADGALRFAYTDLTATNYMNFLQDTNESGTLSRAPLATITTTGVALTNAFLSGIATNNQGVILVEAVTPTIKPLVLTIYHGTNQIAQTSLPLSISDVEQMFRHKNLLLSVSPAVPDRLTDASVPNEPDTIDKNFVFVHGYNVNTNQARGWDADIYKRLYWSGSHAKFYGVTWSASDSQVDNQVTINLQTNIVHAFNTAPLLNTFLNSLSGTNIVAAHSLGNIVALSALNDYTNQSINTYFMVDAAVAIEAIDGGAALNPDMYPTAWTNYQSRLWASEWFNLWPTNDARSMLTWSGRLANLQNANVYNFYSSGEEVLRDYPVDPPTNLLGIATGQLAALWKGDTGEYTWAWQEKLKGLMPLNSILSSDHGGWSFNLNYYTYYEDGAPPTHMSPSNAASLPNSELQTNAFFDFTSEYNGYGIFTADLALYGSNGSAYAQTNRNRILSDAIPALTLPVGANPVPKLSPPQNPTENNFDMQTVYENGWPLGRHHPQYPIGTIAAGEWHHSDVRAISYTFTYKLFNQMVTVGNLK